MEHTRQGQGHARRRPGGPEPSIRLSGTARPGPGFMLLPPSFLLTALFTSGSYMAGTIYFIFKDCF